MPLAFNAFANGALPSSSSIIIARLIGLIAANIAAISCCRSRAAQFHSSDIHVREPLIGIPGGRIIPGDYP